MNAGPRRDLLYHLLAPTFLILTPFISFVTYNNYSYTAPEIWICLAGLTAIALLCGLAGIVGGWPVRVALTTGLLVLWADLQFDWFDAYNPWPQLRVVGFFLLALILCFVLRRHLSRTVTAVFATMLVSTVVLAAFDAAASRGSGDAAARRSGDAAITEPGPPADPQLPILVHFIFDEHIGIEGLPDDVPYGREMRGSLLDFFDKYGFRVFGRAYSRYVNTYNSLANLLNLSSDPVDGAFTSGVEPYVLLSNRYFELLGSKGYNIHVYQSNYMDFCTAAKEHVVECAERNITGIKSIESLDIPVSDKAELISHRFMRLSALQRVAGSYYRHVQGWSRSAGWTLPDWWFKDARLGPVPVMPLFDDVTADVAGAPPGDMFFVYMGIPHFPYVYDATCVLRPVAEWEQSLDPPPMPANDRESRARRYGLYLEQMMCLYHKLDAMFQEWQKAGIFDQLVIVIHSDHGAKIYEVRPTAQNQERLSHADYVDGFSTLFAVKGPRHPAGYDRRLVPITQLLGEVVGEEIEAEAEQAPYVFLQGEGGEPMLRQPLPAFGDGG